LRDYLYEQKRAGRMVTFNPPVTTADSLNSVNSTIEQNFGSLIPPQPFVVTDPDISLPDFYHCEGFGGSVGL